jgi:hypothetical protein
MSVIMIRCPQTGREISTGIECEAETFNTIPFVVAQSNCPHCGCQHRWSKEDAWLKDCAPQKLEEAVPGSPTGIPNVTSKPRPLTHGPADMSSR